MSNLVSWYSPGESIFFPCKEIEEFWQKANIIPNNNPKQSRNKSK